MLSLKAAAITAGRRIAVPGRGTVAVVAYRTAPQPRSNRLWYCLTCMVKEGYYFGLPPLVLSGAAFLAHWIVAASVLLGLAVFVFYFFRDPERVIPGDSDAVVSPADGRIVVVTDEEQAGAPGKRISIFLAIWNVHVNRSPAAGTIRKMEYRPGKFLAAMVARASAENEQNVISLSTASGEMVFKQIAGLIARRVVCWKKAGDIVQRGERIGLVRFGSRVDLWVPSDAQILVALGDHVKGGASVLARWPVPAVSNRPQEAEARATVENLTTAGKRT